MKRTYIKELKESIGEEVEINGFVSVRRDHGKLIFLDVRDMTGTVQVVVLPNHAEAKETAEKLRPEWVVEIHAKVNKRPDNMVKKDELNGELELEALEIKILNSAETPPFDVLSDGKEIGEETRLEYRYLDLRRPRMQNNMRMRHRVINFFREYMTGEGFVEIETPMLMKDTPEGSREYVVPSRVWPGSFYALPQSPQQFKQLLMVSGFEKYFQVARCMRDEDLRGDRQPEFTQLDFEMSFVEQKDVLEFTEKMFIDLVEKLYPEKTFTEKPFPVMTYDQAMEKYGTDKPDLRKDKNNPNELAFVWVIDFPMFETLEDGTIQAKHHPFCSVKPEDLDKFMKGEDLLNIKANAYDLILNGYELSSGSIRIHQKDVQEQVFNLLNISKEDQEKRFGHILRAFTYGAPPHGGFAPGIDRVVMLLQGEPNIREVIAFPKTGEARDLMMGSPVPIAEKQLNELGLEIKKKK